MPLTTTFSLAGNSIENVTNCAQSTNALYDFANVDNIWDFTGITLDAGTRINGLTGNDTITGSAGNDIIIGGVGNDSLTGGAGDDTFLYNEEGSPGADTVIDGGTGTDTITCNDASDDASLPTTFSLAGNSIEIITNCIDSSGSQLKDNAAVDNTWDFTGITLDAGTGITSYGGNDVISGSAVAEVIDAGGGNDSIHAGGGDDTILYNDEGTPGDDIFIHGGTGTDTIICNDGGDDVGLPATFSLAGNSIEAISNCTYSGDSHIKDLGARANTWDFTGITMTSGSSILGGSGNDVITGSAAADRIEGGSGADTIVGGDGDDIIVYNEEGSPDSDTSINGGNGTDTIHCNDASDDVPLPQNFSVALNSIEAVTNCDDSTGNQLKDNLAVANVWDFTGMTMDAGTGISGGTGNDTITGSAGAEVIYGGSGNDTIDGAGGDDHIRGEGGNDQLTGGAGNDIFKYSGLNSSAGYDTVLNGGTGTDTIECTGSSTDVSMPQTFSLAGNSIENIDCDGYSNTELDDGGNVDNTWDFTGITFVGTPGSGMYIGSEGGDDTITMNNGATEVQLGTGNDTLIYVNESHIASITTINGSTGVSDTVHLNFTTGYNGALDSWLLDKGFEYLDLTNTGNDTPSLYVYNVDGTIYINGDGAGDDITTLDTPTHVAGGDVNVGGIDYGGFKSNGDTMYVEFGLKVDGVTVVANP